MDWDDNHRDRVLGERADPPFDPDHDAWESHCAGTKSGHHECGHKLFDPDLGERWQCKWCWQWKRPRHTKGRP